MSDNLAQDYAESVGKGFWEAYEAGAVFGWDYCMECGADQDDPCAEDCTNENRDPVSVYEWLAEGIVDLEYVVSRAGEYRGAEVLISYGGPNAWIDTRERPNAWIDTRERVLHVSWGGRATWALPDEMIRELDEALEELWSMR